MNNLIGKQVIKKSGKPFKSGNKVNTVSAICINPYTMKNAFKFEEDDSIVDCQQCKEFLWEQ